MSVIEDPDNVLDDLQAYLSQFSVDDSVISDGSEFGSGSGAGVFSYPSPSSLIPRTPRTPRTPGRSPRVDKPGTPGATTPRINSARSTKTQNSTGRVSHSPGASSRRFNGFVPQAESPNTKASQRDAENKRAQGSIRKGFVDSSAYVIDNRAVKESGSYRTPKLIHMSKASKKKTNSGEPPKVQPVPREVSPLPLTDSEESASFSREVKRYNGVSGIDSDPSEVQRARYYGTKDEALESTSEREETDNLQEDDELAVTSVASNSESSAAAYTSTGDGEEQRKNMGKKSVRKSLGEGPNGERLGEGPNGESLGTNEDSSENSREEKLGERLENATSRESSVGVKNEVNSGDESSTGTVSRLPREGEKEAVISGVNYSSVDDRAQSSHEETVHDIEEKDRLIGVTRAGQEQIDQAQTDSQTVPKPFSGAEAGKVKLETPSGAEMFNKSKPELSEGEEESKRELSPLSSRSDAGSNFSPVLPEMSSECEAKADGSVSSGSLAPFTLGARPATVGRESMGNKQAVGRSSSAGDQTGKSSDDNQCVTISSHKEEDSKVDTGDYTYFHFSESDVAPSGLNDGVRTSGTFDGLHGENLRASDSNQTLESSASLTGREGGATEDEEDDIQPYATYSSVKNGGSDIVGEASTLKIQRNLTGARKSDGEETPDVSVHEEPVYATVNKARVRATEAVKTRVHDMNTDSVSEGLFREQILSDQGNFDQSDGMVSMSAVETDEATTTDSEGKFESTSDSDVIVLPIFGRTRRNVASKKYTEVLKELSVVLEKRSEATRTQSMKEDRADAAAALGVVKVAESTRAGTGRPLSKSSENVNNVFVNKSLLSMLERHLVNKNESDKILQPGAGRGVEDDGSSSAGSGRRAVSSENVVRVLKNREIVSGTPEVDSSGSGNKSPVTGREDNLPGMSANSGPRNKFTPMEQNKSQTLHGQPESTNLVRAGSKNVVKSPVDTYGKRVSAKLIYNHSALLSPPQPASPASSYDAEQLNSAADTSNYYSSSSEGVLDTIYSEGKTSGPEDNKSFAEDSTPFVTEAKEEHRQIPHQQHRRSRIFREEKILQPTPGASEHSLSWARGNHLRSSDQSRFISVSSHHPSELVSSTEVKDKEESAACVSHHPSMTAFRGRASPRRDGARRLNKSMDASHVTTIHITGRGLKHQGKITYSEPDLVHALNQTQTSNGGSGFSSVTVSPRRWERSTSHPRSSSFHDTSRTCHAYVGLNSVNVSASNFSLNASISNDMSFGNETFDHDESMQPHNSGPNNYSFDQGMYRSLLEGDQLLTAGYHMVRVNVGSGKDGEGVEIPLAQLPASAAIQDSRALGNDTYFISTGAGSTPLPVTIVRSRSSSFTAFGGDSSGGRSGRRRSPDRRSPVRQASVRTVVHRRQSPSRHSQNVTQSTSPGNSMFSSTIYNHHQQQQYDHNQQVQGQPGDLQRAVVIRTVSLRSNAAPGTVQAKLSRSQTFDRGRPSNKYSNINTLYRVSSQQQVHQPLYSKKQHLQYSPRYRDVCASEGNLTRGSFYGGNDSNFNFSSVSGSRVPRLIPDDQVSDVSEASEASHLYVVLPSEGPRPVSAARELTTEHQPEHCTEQQTELQWRQRRLPPDGSPFHQEISEGILPSAHGDGLHKGEEDKPATFLIDARGLKGEPQVQVDGPNAIAKCSIDPLSDGQYKVTYIPVEVGLFSVNVKWNGKEIPGSPFHPKVVDSRKVKVVGGWQHYMDGNERIHLVVGEEKRIPFDTSEAGPGQLRAEVKSPSSFLPVQVDDEHKGKSTVVFTPREEGTHYLNLYWSDHPLVNSPYVGYATSGVADPSKVWLTGRGLKEAIVGEEAEFVIDGSQAGPGEPDVALTGVRAEIQVIKSSLGGGKFLCTYIPFIPGAYLLNISWNGRQLRGAPYKVNVIGASYPDRVIVTGEGLRGGLLGQSLDFRIDTKKAGPGELTAYCMGPSQVAYCELSDHHHGTYRLVVRPQETGRHVLQIKYGGVHVQGSPFAFKVSAQPDASKVRVSGPGVEHGILANFHSEFIVETRGAGAGQLTVRIRGPKGAFQVEMYRESQKDRKILCRYYPTSTGQYIIHVRWSDVDVPGSPFQVYILDTHHELEQVLHEQSFGAGHTTLQHNSFHNTSLNSSHHNNSFHQQAMQPRLTAVQQNGGAPMQHYNHTHNVSRSSGYYQWREDM